MNLKYKHIKLLISFFTLIMVSQLFYSCNKCHRHSPDKKINRFVSFVKKNIELNQEQEVLLDNIKNEWISKKKKHYENKKTMKQFWIDEFKKDQINKTKVLELFAEREKEHSDLRKFMLSSTVKFHKVLKPAQRKKLSELMQEKLSSCCNHR